MALSCWGVLLSCSYRRLWELWCSIRWMINSVSLMWALSNVVPFIWALRRCCIRWVSIEITRIICRCQVNILPLVQPVLLIPFPGSVQLKCRVPRYPFYSGKWERPIPIILNQWAHHLSSDKYPFQSSICALVGSFLFDWGVWVFFSGRSPFIQEEKSYSTQVNQNYWWKGSTLASYIKPIISY